MNSEGKFWITIWSIVAVVIVVCTLLYYVAEDKYNEKSLVLMEQGLQPYKVERCIAVSIETEWHEAGWKDK